MLDELKTNNKIVGLKQTRRGIIEGKVTKVFIAEDADSRITTPLIEECKNNGIEVEYAKTMMELGAVSGIDVGAAVAAIVK